MKSTTKTTKTERFELRLDPEVLEKIDSWRSEQLDIPSRSETVRKLVDAGLGRPEDRQIFQLTRFNLLWAAMNDPQKVISDAYAYAWKAGVYPMFDDGASLHIHFADQFKVSEDMMDELSKHLDDCWQEKAVPSFYELENHYKVRSGRTVWDRSLLLRACRYMFLRESFDKCFWEALLRGTDHPTEAKSIIRNFDRARHIHPL